MKIYKDVKNVRELFNSLKEDLKKSLTFQYYVKTYVVTETSGFYYESKIVLEDSKGIPHIVNYIDNAYDENMKMKVNPNVEIIGFGFVENLAEIIM